MADVSGGDQPRLRVLLLQVLHHLGRPGLPRSVERVAGRHRSRRHGPGSRSAGQPPRPVMPVRPTCGTPGGRCRPARAPMVDPRAGGPPTACVAPVGDDRTPATAPDSTPVTTKHPPRDGGSVFAVRRGVRSCRMPPPFCGPHDADHPAGANAPKSVTRSCTCGTERTSDWGSLATAPCEGHLPAAQTLRAEDPSRLTSSCSAASSSCSAALSSAASLHRAATSNRHHRCNMTHMHTAAATTTTAAAAADHQYATRAARTGTPTLARIGCRSAHDRRCMYSR
jgi:hypothetical protein